MEVAGAEAHQPGNLASPQSRRDRLTRRKAILTVDDVNFLVGGAAGSVSLLAILDKQDKQPDAALPRIQIRSNQIIPSTELSA